MAVKYYTIENIFSQELFEYAYIRVAISANCQPRRPVRGFDILLFSLGFSLSQGIFFDCNAARPVFSGFGAALAAFSRSPYLMPAVD